MQLTLAPEEQMAEQARQLIERVQQEESGILSKNEIIEVVTTIAAYKFVHLSREEVEAMLGLSLQETRVYQDAKAEGERETKIKMVAKLFTKGLSVEEIAEIVELTIEEVKQASPQAIED